MHDLRGTFCGKKSVEKFEQSGAAMKPEPGAPREMDGDTRIAAYDCDRLGRMYVVQCKFGWDTWQDHGSPHESYADALAQGQRVARRERSERPDRYIESDVDDRPDSHAMRIPMYPEAAVASPDPPHLSDRIRRGRRRVGWR